jgi:hypothetical protein
VEKWSLLAILCNPLVGEHLLQAALQGARQMGVFLVSRVRAFFATLVLAASAIPATTSVAQVPNDPTGLLSSENITLLTSLPNPGIIGARFRDGLMYATSLTGLTVYDVTDPAAPAEVSRLPLPHFENEDVDLGGNILLISNDAAESTGILHVVDISDPAAPALLTSFQMGGDPVSGGPGHTASCVLDCRFAWVTDSGGIRVIDLTDPANPVDKGTFESPAYGEAATHDVQVDANGLAWVVGFGGAVAYKLPKNYTGDGLGKIVAQTDERGLSTYFEELGIGDGSNPNDFILHNSHRTKNSGVVYITEEDYNRPGCRGAGSFETWKVPVHKKGPKKGAPTGEQVTLIDQWATELNVAGAASPAVMCSAHYFDVRGKVVAQGWYEQGTRFLDVSDPADVRQIGYFIPPNSLNWAAYFPPTDLSGSIVYSFDATHGIDVLQLALPGGKGRNAPTVKAAIRPEWFAESPVGTPTDLYGFACRLGLAGDLGLDEGTDPDLPPLPLP